MTISLLQHRDSLQREIIIYTMKLNQFHHDDFDLILKEPFEFEHAYYRPYSSERGKETLKIMGVDGSTGDLLCENEYREPRWVYYHELTLEELIRLHQCVLQGEYVIQILI